MRRANKAPGSCFATTPRHKGAASTGHRPSTETGGQRVRTDTSHPSSKALQPLKQTAPLRGWNRCDAVLRTRDVHKSSEAIPSRQRPGRIMTPEVRHLHVDVISSHIIYHFYGYMCRHIYGRAQVRTFLSRIICFSCWTRGTQTSHQLEGFLILSSLDLASPIFSYLILPSLRISSLAVSHLITSSLLAAPILLSPLLTSSPTLTGT